MSLKSGGTANLRPNGKVRSIDRGGVHIQYGLHGDRKIVSEHNGARIVTTGSHRGYVQRPYVVRNGHTYVQRTYVVNHVAYTAAYRSYYYGGAYYYGYRPAFYYHPGFYGWAYNPWPAPVYWSWGWTPAVYPWYGYYGYYFAPYPSYPSAAFWLTDYLISANLEAAYAARADATSQDDTANNDTQPVRQDDSTPQPTQQTVALSPEVKQAIAEEVKAQIAAEQNASGQNTTSGGSTTAANGDVPPALDPARRTFVVSDSLDVTADDQECALTPGDVITRLTDTPDQDQKVTVSVSTSKKTDCAPGKQVAVSVEALQEMQNHFREQLDSGLKVLAEKQGTGNLPNAPDTGTIPGEVPAPPPDTTAAKALQDQQATADQTGAEVAREASGQGS